MSVPVAFTSTSSPLRLAQWSGRTDPAVVFRE